MTRFANRPSLERHQLSALRELMSAVCQSNPFYQAKFGALDPVIASSSLPSFAALVPFTHKPEVIVDQQTSPPYGTNLTYPLNRYLRCHQTSGSIGAPIRWLDTRESWDWMLQNWARVFDASGITSEDRIFFAFSFGPFLGFWTAFEAATRLGCLTLPGGGLSTVARLRMLIDLRASVLCCTPTYALHLGEVASKEGIDLQQSAVRRIIVAGEPGGSVPATRARLESFWRPAQIFDHHGMTEVGPVSYPCPSHPGKLHIIEAAYLAEVLTPDGSSPTPPGEVGELILTTLGRVGSPLIRYRTCDRVRASAPSLCACGSLDLALVGGILGRTDDMVVIRGVNIYPNAVEEVIRRVGDIAEYQVTVLNPGAMAEIQIQVEPEPGCTDPEGLRTRLVKELQNTFALRFEVATVPQGTLPRFELKARRWLKG